jgi:dihydroorotate dehydrogenase electron transfer subunit
LNPLNPLKPVEPVEPANDPMPPLDIDAVVIANERLSHDYSVLTLGAPEVGARTEPGQFVMVKPTDSTGPLLRRPFSVFEVVRNAHGEVSAISLLNKRAGPSTSRLYELEVGDRVACLGPLGKPFTAVAPPTEAWMVAGGVGLAPFATLAETLAANGTDTTLFYGARSANELFYLEFFERLGVRLVLATEDGSRGVKARVTGPLEDALRSRTKTAHDERRPTGHRPSTPEARVMIYGCGPEPMLAAVAKLAARYHQPSQVSVERVMGCGLGGCYSCVVPVRHGDEHAHLVRSCINGPVFDGDELVWD